MRPRFSLQWYVTEQTEEEENDNDIISQLKLIGSDTAALFFARQGHGSPHGDRTNGLLQGCRSRDEG